ncbi:MAG: group III truncated hemoglobin [Bacteroidota bacterium]|nr:group III truncated hemoglobin [Bacteroidota bacterium]
MKNDITTRRDIEQLVNTFYDKVQRDAIIGPIFIHVAKVNWDHHLPIMYSFWAGILLEERTYVGNPMMIHEALNKKSPLLQYHFDSWVRLFYETVDELFAGRNAEYAKEQGSQIAQLMHHKMRESEQ